MRLSAILCSLVATSLVSPTLAAPVHVDIPKAYSPHTYPRYFEKRFLSEGGAWYRLLEAAAAGLLGGFVWSGADDIFRKMGGLNKRDLQYAESPEQKDFMAALQELVAATSVYYQVKSDERLNAYGSNMNQADDYLTKAKLQVDAAFEKLEEKDRHNIAEAMKNIEATGLSKFKLSRPPVESEGRAAQILVGLTLVTIDSSFKRRDRPSEDSFEAQPTLQPADRDRLADLLTDAALSRLNEVSDKSDPIYALKEIPEGDRKAAFHQVFSQLISKGDSYPSNLSKRTVEGKVLEAAAGPFDKFAWKSLQFWKDSGWEILKNTGIGVIATGAFSWLFGRLGIAGDGASDSPDGSQKPAGSPAGAEEGTEDLPGPYNEDTSVSRQVKIPKQPADHNSNVPSFPSSASGPSGLSKRNNHLVPRTFSATMWEAFLGAIGFALGGVGFVAATKGNPEFPDIGKRDLGTHDHPNGQEIDRRGITGFATFLLGLATSLVGTELYDDFFKEKKPEEAPAPAPAPIASKSKHIDTPSLDDLN
ncbi:hypothetical protein FRB99_005935 [Tulasnella sp. 403]|nr:hypothetical protein FRB99_005935 [Tulasnella sp. 403]